MSTLFECFILSEIQYHNLNVKSNIIDIYPADQKDGALIKSAQDFLSCGALDVYTRKDKYNNRDSQEFTFVLTKDR